MQGNALMEGRKEGEELRGVKELFVAEIELRALVLAQIHATSAEGKSANNDIFRPSQILKSACFWRIWNRAISSTHLSQLRHRINLGRSAKLKLFIFIEIH